MSPLGTTLWSLDPISNFAAADQSAGGVLTPGGDVMQQAMQTNGAVGCTSWGRGSTEALFTEPDGCLGSANRLPAVTLLILHWTGCIFSALTGGCVWSYCAKVCYGYCQSSSNSPGSYLSFIAQLNYVFQKIIILKKLLCIIKISTAKISVKREHQ